MDLKEKQKVYVLFGIIGIAALFIYFNLLLKPAFSKFISKNREFCSLKASFRSSKDLIDNKDRLSEQYDSIKKEAELIEKRFPGQDEISVILEDLSRIAEASGVKILRIKPLEEELKGSSEQGLGFYSEFPILIEARAGYHQSGLFINQLESADRFIKITELDIKRSSEDSRRHNIKLKACTYVLR